MARNRFDRGSKWLIRTHGDVVLRLGGVTDIPKWQAVPNEVVQPLQIPDGLIEVERPTGKSLYLVEIATYADGQVKTQLLDDISATDNAFHELPEAIVFVLRPKGNAKVDSSIELRKGQTYFLAGWQVVELWKLDARESLATGEPALMPWVPLASFAGEPEPLLRECRSVIETKAVEQELPNLLALAHVFATLTINDSDLLHRLLEERPMIMESPFVQELVFKAETRQRAEDIKEVLEGRFGFLPSDLVSRLEALVDRAHLKRLVNLSGRCQDIEEFRIALFEVAGD